MFSPHLRSSPPEYWSSSQRNVAWKCHKSAYSPFRDKGNILFVFTLFHLWSGFRFRFIYIFFFSPVVITPPALLIMHCSKTPGRMGSGENATLPHWLFCLVADSHLWPSCCKLSSASRGGRCPELPDADTCSVLQRIERQLQSSSHQLWHRQETDCSHTGDNRN